MSTPPSSLEDRIAALEKIAQASVTSDQAMAQAMQDAVGRVNAMEQAMLDTLTALHKGLGALDRKFTLEHAYQSLAHVSGIYPKSRSVVFVGRTFFGDNTKYAYLAFCDYARQHDIACTFVTEDPAQHALLTAAGLPCLPPATQEWTAEEIRTVLGARVAVLGDYFYPHNWRNPALYAFLQGATTIQLWHGIPIKGIGLQNVPPRLAAGDAGDSELMAAAGPYDVFIGSTEAAEPVWAKRFSFGTYAPIGMPREDIFARPLAGSDLINTDRETLAHMQRMQDEGRPVILYVPTFREGAGTGWIEQAGLERFVEHCRSLNYALFVNLHPADQNAVGNLQAKLPGACFLRPGTDIFPALKQADILMTGYSSLAFDFLLVDRPIIFFRPGHESYVAPARGLIGEHADFMPGAVAHDIETLKRIAVEAVAALRAPTTDPFAGARRAYRERFFDHADGRACERLCALIERNLVQPGSVSRDLSRRPDRAGLG